MRWETCLDEHIVHHQTTDATTVHTLRDQSKDTLATAKRISLDPTTSRSKALLAYDALRELLEALAYSEGYDIHNHECYKAFLQEILGASDLARSFDDLRRKRNALEYDAEQIPTDDVETYVERITALYNKVETLF